jgi:hypothetical protein
MLHDYLHSRVLAARARHVSEITTPVFVCDVSRFVDDCRDDRAVFTSLSQLFGVIRRTAAVRPTIFSMSDHVVSLQYGRDVYVNIDSHVAPFLTRG